MDRVGGIRTRKVKGCVHPAPRPSPVTVSLPIAPDERDAVEMVVGAGLAPALFPVSQIYSLLPSLLGTPHAIEKTAVLLVESCIQVLFAARPPVTVSM